MFENIRVKRAASCWPGQSEDICPSIKKFMVYSNKGFSTWEFLLRFLKHFKIINRDHLEICLSVDSMPSPNIFQTFILHGPVFYALTMHSAILLIRQYSSKMENHLQCRATLDRPTSSISSPAQLGLLSLNTMVLKNRCRQEH